MDTMDDLQSLDAREKLMDVIADFERELKDVDTRFQARIAQILEEVRQRKMEQLRRDIEKTSQ